MPGERMTHDRLLRPRRHARGRSTLLASLAGLAMAGCGREVPEPSPSQLPASPEAPAVAAPTDVPPPDDNDPPQAPALGSTEPVPSPELGSPPASGTPLGSRGACLVPGPTGPTMAERVLEAAWCVRFEDWIDQVDVVDGMVLVQVDGHGLEAFDAATGERRWQEPRFPQDAEALVAAERFLIWDPAQWSISALAPATGKRLWKRNLVAAPRAVVACRNHRVVVATHRGHVDGGRERTLYASSFDPLDGTLLWSVPMPGAVIQTLGDAIIVQRPGRDVDETARIDCATPPTASPTWIEGLALAGSKGNLAVDILDAGPFEGHLVRSEGGQQLCLRSSSPATEHCFDPAEGHGDMGVRDLLVKGGVAYYALYPMTAKARSRSSGKLVAWALGEGKLWEFRGATGPRIVDGGSTIVAAGRNRSLLLEPRTSAVLACLPTTDLHDPAVALDGERMIVHANEPIRNDDIQPWLSVVCAVELPTPGPRAASPAAVSPAPGAALPASSSEGRVVLREISSFRGHPKRGMSSGSMMVGTIHDLAFLDSEHIVVGGNDNHLGVYRFRDGKQVSRTKGGAKDLLEVEPCGATRVAASTLVPEIVLFERGAHGFRRERKLHGSFLSWIEGCEWMLVDRERTLAVVNAATGADRANLAIDKRYNDVLRARGERVIVRMGAGFELVEATVDGVARIRPVTVPPTDGHGGGLTQVWLAADDTMVREYCSDLQCSVELASLDGEVKETWTFDVIGGPIAEHSSRIDRSPGGRFLLFRRRHLLPWFIDRTEGMKRLIANGSGPDDSGYQSVAFSQDGTLLALGGHPKPYEVTVLELPR